MTNLNQPFNDLLEAYLLKVADQVIELASEPMQAKLIQQILHVNTSSAAVNQLLPQPIKELASEWQQLLSEPVESSLTDQQRLKRVLIQRLQWYDEYLADLLSS
ncbi:hypothetical protein GCM10027341_15220 [Spirosoma knui]